MDSIIARGLAYIASQQTANGAIYGQAATDQYICVSSQTQPTIFFSAFILESLRSLPGAAELRTDLANYLAANRSADWTWNYWERDSPLSKSQPYPDDLDDTCCALVGLIHNSPGIVSGELLGKLARILTSHEDQVGGPYQTWIVDSRRSSTWRDIDLGVNANIGYLLNELGALPTGLNDYITEVLESSQPLVSSYYCGELPLLYFISRWYAGPASMRLHNKLNQYIQAYRSLNCLELSLCISAVNNTGMSVPELPQLKIRLIGMQEQGYWPAVALYRDPPIDGVDYYAGSAALTTAFALEALCWQPAQQATAQRSLGQSRAVNKALEDDLAKLPISDMRDIYQATISRIRRNDDDDQICTMASITAGALGVSLESSITTELDKAQINGWVAYTLYDDILDNAASAKYLGAASYAMRLSNLGYRRALAKHDAYHQLVNDVFIIVDAANTWEFTHTRATLLGSTFQISQLPDYRDYDQLAARSWGHILAASGVLCQQGYAVTSAEHRAIRQFFRHYLIARQLNDDAHDWEEDIRRGQLSAVVCLLLRRPRTVRLNRDLPRLRQRFWTTTLDEVVILIDNHVALARIALATCPFVDRGSYESWLQQLETATHKAQTERNRTLEFINSYNGR
ncbi:MAG: hypothetical protein ABIV43_00880 [Candidatus Saccharimonadales bacterium]